MEQIERPLLSLVMMVKNEAASIQQLLTEVKPHIDRYTILDTGSTDGTQDIIREVMAGVPGHLVEEPFISVTQTKQWEGFEDFIDYGATRNRVLDLDSGATLIDGEMVPAANAPIFTLMLSGDEYLREGAKLREHLEQHRTSNVDCHFVRVTIDDSTIMYSPRILRTGSAWRYDDVVHEVPYNRKDPKAPAVGVPGALIEHRVIDEERRLANIEEKHIPLLEKVLAEEPKNARALFYLAQSYKVIFPYMDPGTFLTTAMRVMSFYIRRLALPFAVEAERHVVQMNYLEIARQTGVYSVQELFGRAKTLCENDPARPETALLLAETAQLCRPLPEVYELAAHAAEVAAAAMEGALDDSSPISMSSTWQAHFLAGMCARQLVQKRPHELLDDGKTWQDRMKFHIGAGLKAGGPWPMFKKIAEPLPEKPPVTLAATEVPAETPTDASQS